MRADETGAGASRGGMMPPVTSRPGVRAAQSMATGDTIAPPAVWHPQHAAHVVAETLPDKQDTVIEVAEPTQPEVSESAPAAAEPAAIDTSEVFEPWAEAPATEPEPAVEEEPWAEPVARAAAGPVEEDEPWAAAAITDTEAPADDEPWSQAPITEPESAAEPPIELLPLIEPPPSPEPAAEAEEEPTPLLEEFALDSFLEAATEMAVIEEPEIEAPEIEEPEFERQVEEPAAETHPGELAWQAPPVDDVVTEALSSTETTSPTDQMRERLEKIAHDLRGGDANEIIRKLAAGDRLDALLAGLLAGFLARSGD